MKRASLWAVVVLLAAAVEAAEIDGAATPVVVTPVLSTAVTASGQPIVLPSTGATVTVSTYDIARGATLPEHMHPYPRYAYVLAGTLRVTNTETGRSDVYRTGDFIIEAIGQWHRAVGLDDQPVRLLVIDQVAGDHSNVVVRQ
jgi:quercetin dioxygenase-like cupin family protein